MQAAGPDNQPIAVSVVVPVKDEEENIIPLATEIVAALDGVESFEIVYVDDGSGDRTPAILEQAKQTFPMLRSIRHKYGAGQSNAINTGVHAARGEVIATLDGDGQNDPADIPALLQRYREVSVAEKPFIMIAGWRAKRKDTWLKRISSKVANGVRSTLLGDATPDTGCGLKVFTRAMFVDFPAFNHMHRFMPALTIRAGGKVISVPVNHRPRERGQSKYGLFNRLWVGIVDIFGVMWLKSRPARVEIDTKDTSRSS